MESDICDTRMNFYGLGRFFFFFEQQQKTQQSPTISSWFDSLGSNTYNYGLKTNVRNTAYVFIN